MNCSEGMKKGFTLLEVLISLAIISAALITIIYTVNYHLSLIQRHEVMTVATLLGREKLIEMTAQQRDKTGTFSEPFDAYSYEVEIVDTPYEGIKLMKLYVTKEKERVYLSKFVRQ